MWAYLTHNLKIHIQFLFENVLAILRNKKNVSTDELFSRAKILPLEFEETIDVENFICL